MHRDNVNGESESVLSLRCAAVCPPATPTGGNCGGVIRQQQVVAGMADQEIWGESEGLLMLAISALPCLP